LVSAPDARRSSPGGNSWKERRTAPRHAKVSVRVDGTWRRGKIVEWITELSSSRWECVIVAEDRQESPPWQGRFLFDPRSIHPRYSDNPRDSSTRPIH
jgi:hypothetical protein